ncbi:MAG: nicotinamide-nucleotide amidohydrolase family protein [Achromobacter sp.]|jgi:nicotinamide-nucleotide amidase
MMNETVLNTPALEEDVVALAEQLGQDLQRQGWLVGVAESCTGGLLGATITSVAGSSAWFDRGFITYSNDAKIENLEVSPETLERHGAVSEPVAIEMASGVLLGAPDAHVAVSITGIAGPDGGTPGKPVGMVCFGFAVRAGEGITTRAATRVFPGNRAEIRLAAVGAALRGLLESIDARVTDVRATPVIA